MPSLSIVILTCNQIDFTRQCLQSLRDVDAEIIVVDNASVDDTPRMIAEEFPRIKYIRNDHNIGVAPGRNVGLSHASGQQLMLLDNDTLPSIEVIASLSAYLDKHPEVGLVAPALVSASGELQASFKPYPGLGVKIANIFCRKRRVELPESPIEPCYVIGAAQMFTRRAWELAGPLDNKIFYGPEDADFCIRLRQCGLRVVYLPHVSIIHHWQRATNRRLLSPLARKHIAGLWHFWIKHRRFF